MLTGRTPFKDASRSSRLLTSSRRRRPTFASSTRTLKPTLQASSTRCGTSTIDRYQSCDESSRLKKLHCWSKARNATGAGALDGSGSSQRRGWRAIALTPGSGQRRQFATVVSSRTPLQSRPPMPIRSRAPAVRVAGSIACPLVTAALAMACSLAHGPIGNGRNGGRFCAGAGAPGSRHSPLAQGKRRRAPADDDHYRPGDCNDRGIGSVRPWRRTHVQEPGANHRVGQADGRGEQINVEKAQPR